MVAIVRTLENCRRTDLVYDYLVYCQLHLQSVSRPQLTSYSGVDFLRRLPEQTIAQHDRILSRPINIY